MDGMKYFLLNKREDFVIHKRYLCSDLMDSGDKQTEWSRITVYWKKKRNEVIKIWLFVAEQEFLIWNGMRYDIRQLILEEELSMGEKFSIFSACEVFCAEGITDSLLNEVKGRYMWLIADTGPEEEMVAAQIEVQIFFQADSWLSFLPEIYRKQAGEDSFLFRYLSIFQWIYYDMGQTISSVPHMFYPAYADSEFLEWIAGWFGMENITVWNREQLIYLIENGRRLFGIRGTKEYMEELILLYTGHKPLIVEYYQIDSYRTDIRKTKILERLYGENAYMVTIILPEGAVSSQQEISILHRIIQSAAPAYIECRMVVLEPYIFLDRYTYIGINSCLGGYKSIKIDNKSLTPYISMIPADKL